MTPTNSTNQLRQPLEHNQPSLEFRQVPLELIKPDEAINAITTGNSPGTTGIMMPVVVFEQKGHYHLIDGYSRWHNMKTEGRTTCDCALLTPAPDTQQATLLRITLNRSRTLPLAEKLLSIERLTNHRDAPFYQEVCSILARNHKEVMLLEMLSTCNETLKKAVCSGHIDLTLVAEINQLPPIDRDAVTSLYSQFPFSRQTQKELADWLPELGFREQTSIAEIIAAPWLQEIISHQRLNPPQKIDKIRHRIYERRFPTIVKAKKTWETRARAINPDAKAVQFKSAEAFEKNRLDIKITVSSAQQALSIFSKLAAVSEATWDQLIYPAQLYGDFTP